MAKETKKPGAVATPVTAQPTATYDYSAQGASGFENVQREDLGIPFLSILQKGSPQIDTDHEDHESKKIEGCEVGDIINTVSNTVICSAGEEMQFIPCSYQKLFMEWTPREKGGGLIKTHRDANILNECQRNEKGQDVLRNGNIIVTTAYFYGIAIIDGDKMPCVIGLTSTQLKKAKQWLNIATNVKLTSPAGVKYTPPFYSHTYLLSTTAESNAKGNWRGWVIRLGNIVSDPVLIAESIDYSKRAGSIQKQITAPNPAEDDDVEKHLS
jgi:hypothetical protein